MEGSEEINNSLQIKRADSILLALKNNQESEFKSRIISSTNWELFEKQIEKGFLCSTFVWYMLYYIGEIDYITYVGKVPSPRHLFVYLNKTGKVKPLIKIN